MFDFKRTINKPWLVAVVLFGVTGNVFGKDGGELRFNRDIRPILVTKCFLCHGPDGKHREADLQLDQEDGIKTAFDGKLDKSEAWMRINSNDPDMRMPPPDSHKELKKEEIELLGRWISQGAKWEGHWSFIPPKKPIVPTVKNQSWGRTAIDTFILARLEQEDLSPNSPAGRERQMRRVYMDLIGLPPSIAEIDAFVGDKSNTAYEKVVDRLLASRHFGERMALVWMDAARYGDSSVFHADGPRDMWAWRDWVIRAYNNNKPFDKFTIEQLAGDHLPGATVDQRSRRHSCGTTQPPMKAVRLPKSIALNMPWTE
ncbi:MAG: DUF1549 domain-containing protein [Planctomycetes bacterium]|nr:DUF1549 domain-containing protein [Planctomycetota bacterium]